MSIASNLPSFELVSIASNSIGSSSEMNWPRVEAALPEAKPLAALYHNKNGFVVFESAFIVLPLEGNTFCPGLIDLQASSPWHADPDSPVYNKIVFAANGIGEIFALAGEEVLHVDLVSEELLSRWCDVESFCGDILSNYTSHTAHELVCAWQAKHGALTIGNVLFPKKPYVLGGDYSCSNLIQISLRRALQCNYDLGSQLRGLKDGDEVEIKIVP